MASVEKKSKAGGSCCSKNKHLIKPPLVHRAVVVVINDVPAADFLAVQQGQYPALGTSTFSASALSIYINSDLVKDAVARNGSGATLMSPPTKAVLDYLAESPRVEIHTAATLAAAEKFLQVLDDKDKDVRTLINVLISGNGDWARFYKAPEPLDDDFLIPKQSFDRGTAPKGIGCWASPARARVDYRKWIADPQPPGEGAIGAQQVATEILSKVGHFPKFGA